MRQTKRPGHRRRRERPDVYPPRLRRRGYRHRRGDGDRGDGRGEEGSGGDRRDAPRRITTFSDRTRISAGVKSVEQILWKCRPGHEHRGATLRRSGVREYHRSSSGLLTLEPEGAERHSHPRVPITRIGMASWEGVDITPLSPFVTQNLPH